MSPISTVPLNHVQFIVRPQLPRQNTVVAPQTTSRNKKAGSDNNVKSNAKKSKIKWFTLRHLLGIDHPDVLDLTSVHFWSTLSRHFHTALHCDICVIGDLREDSLVKEINLIIYYFPLAIANVGIPLSVYSMNSLTI